jgi:hypothetical protein
MQDRSWKLVGDLGQEHVEERMEPLLHGPLAPRLYEPLPPRGRPLQRDLALGRGAHLNPAALDHVCVIPLEG